LLSGLAHLRWIPNVGQMRFIYGGTGKTEPPLIPVQGDVTADPNGNSK